MVLQGKIESKSVAEIVKKRRTVEEKPVLRKFDL